jgi:transposase
MKEQEQEKEEQKNQVKFLTQEEVADRFRVSIGTIINWRKKGLLRYFRVSGSTRVLYPIDTVEELEQQSLHQEREVFKPNKIIRERPEISPRQQKDWRI